MQDEEEVKQFKEELKNKPQEGEVLTPKPPVTCAKGEHSFTLVRTDMGPAAECRCGLGFQISPGAEIKDGHIFVHGTLVV